jgi:hypothetical protein
MEWKKNASIQASLYPFVQQVIFLRNTRECSVCRRAAKISQWNIKTGEGEALVNISRHCSVRLQFFLEVFQNPVPPVSIK